MLKIGFKKAKKMQTISQVIIFPEIFGLNSKIPKEKKFNSILVTQNNSFTKKTLIKIR